MASILADTKLDDIRGHQSITVLKDNATVEQALKAGPQVQADVAAWPAVTLLCLVSMLGQIVLELPSHSLTVWLSAHYLLSRVLIVRCSLRSACCLRQSRCQGRTHTAPMAAARRSSGSWMCVTSSAASSSKVRV